MILPGFVRRTGGPSKLVCRFWNVSKSVSPLQIINLVQVYRGLTSIISNSQASWIHRSFVYGGIASILDKRLHLMPQRNVRHLHPPFCLFFDHEVQCDQWVQRKNAAPLFSPQTNFHKRGVRVCYDFTQTIAYHFAEIFLPWTWRKRSYAEFLLSPIGGSTWPSWTGRNRQYSLSNGIITIFRVYFSYLIY